MFGKFAVRYENLNLSVGCAAAACRSPDPDCAAALKLRGICAAAPGSLSKLLLNGDLDWLASAETIKSSD